MDRRFGYGQTPSPEISILTQRFLRWLACLLWFSSPLRSLFLLAALFAPTPTPHGFPLPYSSLLLLDSVQARNHGPPISLSPSPLSWAPAFLYSAYITRCKHKCKHNHRSRTHSLVTPTLAYHASYSKHTISLSRTPLTASREVAACNKVGPGVPCYIGCSAAHYMVSPGAAVEGSLVAFMHYTPYQSLHEWRSCQILSIACLVRVW